MWLPSHQLFKIYLNSDQYKVGGLLGPQTVRVSGTAETE